MNRYRVTYTNGSTEIVEADFLNPSNSNHFEFHRYYSYEDSKGEQVKSNRIHLTLHPNAVRRIRLLGESKDPRILTIGERLDRVPNGDSVLILRNGVVQGSYELLSEE
jgi:hypothetical protein